MKAERSGRLLAADSIALSHAVAIKYEVVEWVILVLPSTEPLPASLLFHGDDDVDVPVTLRAVGCDFVYQIIVIARRWHGGLFLFLYERMSAVASRNRGDAVSTGGMLGRGAGEKVAACAFFAAGIICEEVLKQPWRCLACNDSMLVAATNLLKSTVPGAMAVTARNVVSTVFYV
jgi:hypothetical protein